MASADKYQWMQFFASDWLLEPTLNVTGFAAKGLWIDMLCVMWKQPTKGVLPGDLATVAALVRADVETIAPLLIELARNRVFSYGRDISNTLPPGAIVCRRMYRKFHVQLARKAAGRSGGITSGAVRRQRVRVDVGQGELHADGAPVAGRDGDSRDGKGGPVVQAGALAGGVLGDSAFAAQGAVRGRYLGALAMRIEAATGDGAAWMAWWRSTLQVFAAAGQLGEIEAAIASVEAAGNADTRRLKGVSGVKAPGRVLSARVLRLARERRIGVGDTPREGG